MCVYVCDVCTKENLRPPHIPAVLCMAHESSLIYSPALLSLYFQINDRAASHGRPCGTCSSPAASSSSSSSTHACYPAPLFPPLLAMTRQSRLSPHEQPLPLQLATACQQPWRPARIAGTTSCCQGTGRTPPRSSTRTLPIPLVC